MCEANWSLILEYLKVFLSWPVVALAIIIVLAATFRKEIAKLIERIEEGSLKDGSFRAPHAPEQQQDALSSSPTLNAEPKTDSVPTAATPTPDTPIGLPPDLQHDEHVVQAIEYAKAHPAESAIAYRRLHRQYLAERTFNLIYGSQIQLLVYLEGRPAGASLSEVNSFYGVHLQRFPGTTYQLHSWIGFLLGQQLIQSMPNASQETYKITDTGLHFLSYIRTNYASFWSHRLY